MGSDCFGSMFLLVNNGVTCSGSMVSFREVTIVKPSEKKKHNYKKNMVSTYMKKFSQLFQQISFRCNVSLKPIGEAYFQGLC